MDRVDIAIVGGGLAGAVTAEEYRKAGGGGSVTILSQERDLPAHRPPLSKEYLRGDESREKVFVHPADFYEGAGIEVRLNTKVEGVDPAERLLRLADGSSLAFGRLVLATGARPRRLTLPGGDLEGVHYLRSLASSERLRQEYARANRAVIIGAGFIGVEVAATLAQRGVDCTVVEAFPRVWPRIVPPVVSDFIQRYFEARGIRFSLGQGVRAIEGDGRVRSVVLENGEVLPADLVVAGVGAALNLQLAEEAGLAVERGGVVVDELLRTSHPDIFAAGDIAYFPDPVGGRLHLEHWDNALHQGRALGRTLAGEPAPFDHIAYFFSDLFDLSLNMIGYPTEWDEIVVRGDPESAAFTAVYGKDGVVRAALMINDDAEFDAWTARVAKREPMVALAQQATSM